MHFMASGVCSFPSTVKDYRKGPTTIYDPSREPDKSIGGSYIEFYEWGSPVDKRPRVGVWDTFLETGRSHV